MFENKDVFDITYHAFWGVGVDGSEGFVPTPETCPNAPGTGVPDYQCCGGGSNPFLLYNANQKKCCSDGKSVVRNNESCPYWEAYESERMKLTLQNDDHVILIPWNFYTLLKLCTFNT